MATSALGHGRARALRVGAALTCVALFAVPLPSMGHELDVSRRAILQVGTEQSDLLVVYEVPAGNAADVLRTLYDTDRDGSLGADEQTALAGKLARDALVGLGTRRDGADLPARAVEWKLDPSPAGVQGFVLALMITLPGGPGRYELTLAGGDATPPILVDFEAGAGLRLRHAVAAPNDDGIALGGLVLGVGDALWFEVAANP